MVALAPMENLSVYQCPNGADSPGLLPMTDMGNWDYGNLEVSPGIIASPTCLPGTPSAGPGALLSVDPSTPQSLPQTLAMHDSKACRTVTLLCMPDCIVTWTRFGSLAWSVSSEVHKGENACC